MKMKALGVTSSHGPLYNRIKELNSDLDQRSSLIAQYEAEIKARHHQIEKKQLYVDRLNREYDDKRKKLEEELGESAESAGPLEIKIKSLRKKIGERVTVCAGLQKEWLKKQHSIMSEATSAEKVKDAMNVVKERKAILDSKKVFRTVSIFCIVWR